MDEALADIGLVDVAVTYRLLTTSDEAAAVPFAGSPTILIDGVDAFPNADRVTELACRVYRTEEGAKGYPTVSQLTAAIRERA
ncbi:alkylmercury lyase [Rhodococcus globerulus]|uniref:Alkylmercury lyase n=1 Tax=Rhodococcus globerulus TaxID=33008 RepID=A0ABU4C5D6_RHOGO|nr:alkylmercury lyase [Rhodococcus globerulus]MDV6271723.1 alkylmercury lyase [Rhodococcus globerulus]